MCVGQNFVDRMVTGKQKSVLNREGTFAKIAPCVASAGEEVILVNDGFSIGRPPDLRFRKLGPVPVEEPRP